MSRQNYKDIRDDWQLAKVLHQQEEEIRRCAFQNVNLTAETTLSLSHTYHDCVFLGCTLPKGFKRQCTDSLFLPRMGETFSYRSHLYTAEDLYDEYEPGHPESLHRCFDARVYRHYLKMGKFPSNLKETLARTLHDHSISDCLHDFLETRTVKSLVGVMGGHAIRRDQPGFEQIVQLSKKLTEDGCLMISGGGPGAMEATHLGAWMAGRNTLELQDALHILRTAPDYNQPEWLDTAMRTRLRYPQADYQSLGIPTWLYGHEPTTPFATHIAKYFDNSIREDGILTIAMGGIIYTPGSAGTLQEIFQEAVQNHYLSYGLSSPMIFLGVDYWSREMPVWPLLTDLTRRGKYKNLLLTLTDDTDEVVEVIRRFRQLPLPEGFALP